MLSCSSQLQCSWMFCWTHRVLAAPFCFICCLLSVRGSWTLGPFEEGQGALARAAGRALGGGVGATFILYMQTTRAQARSLSFLSSWCHGRAPQGNTMKASFSALKENHPCANSCGCNAFTSPAGSKQRLFCDWKPAPARVFVESALTGIPCVDGARFMQQQGAPPSSGLLQSKGAGRTMLAATRTLGL